MAITPLPSPPLVTDDTATFNAKAFAWVAGIDTWTTQANALSSNVTTLESQTAASASAASTSASNALTSANNAANSASAASTSASNALASANSAAASYDSFDDRYLGSKTADPSLDNDGNALLVGALYWNSVGNTMKVWTGTAWVTFNPVNNPVDQTDVGTAPNEIPLNQYLGVMAYVDYPDFTRPFLVANLPAAGVIGRFAHVTDGDAGLAWGATVTNSGSPAGATPYLVWDNGTNWTVAGK
jgi:hypothetical protein